MKSENKRGAANGRRILGRLLATELGPEEMKLVRGAEDQNDVTTLLVTGMGTEDN
jgi:hypothetical protein